MRFHRLPFRSLQGFLLACLLMAGAHPAAAIPSAETIELPELGEPADLALSPGEETRIAAEVAAELYNSDYLLDDAEVSDYIATLGWKLAAKAPGTPPAYRFFVIADPRINAFAVPGGLIGTNAGLILHASNESELAGVMGHEQAHVTQRHLARTANDTSTANIATMVAMLAAIIAGSANPDIITGALALGQSINYQRQVNYTRSHETEADRIGIRTMAAAGYDPEGMASFFSKLEQQSRLYGEGTPEILRTHPVNTTRIAEARMRADRMPKITVREAPEFSLMQARAAVLLASRPNEAVDTFSARLRSGNGTQSPANHYGYALALSRSGRSAEALAALQPALQALPRQINVQLLHSQLRIASGDESGGRAGLSQLLALHPRHAPTVLAQAQAQLDAGQPEAARLTLLSHDQAMGTRPETHRLLAQAAEAQGQIAEQQFQTASYDIQRGNLRGALSQVDAALRLSSLAPQDRSRLQALREELIQRIPREVLADIQRGRRLQQ